jgi:nitrous oxidase accessory protein NosD
VTLSVNGQPAAPGETVDVDGEARSPAFTVTTEVAEGARAGTVTPSLAFHGNGETVRGSLSKIYVHPDPLPVGGDVPSLQAPIDLVAPGTTIELQDGAFSESGAEDRSPLVVGNPVSLVAADGASPRIAVEDVNPEFPAVSVTANDVTLEGVEVAAGGAASAIQLGSEIRGRETDAPSAATLRGVTVGGATTGIDVRSAPAALVESCDVTAGDVGIQVTGGQSGILRGNEVHDVETGIAVDGLVSAVAENRLWNVGGTAIRVGVNQALLERMGAEQGPIRNNVIESATIGIEATPDAAVGVVEGNEFRDVETPTVGLDGGAVADGDSRFGLVLYGLTGASIAVLFVPYARRKLRR